MAYLQPDKPEKVYVPALRAAKEKGEKLVCLTAYDYPTARIVDEAGVEIILVGDSMGNVIHGYRQYYSRYFRRNSFRDESALNAARIER
jgi:3-methyl-2-oxobutanoate hydroxymethyltransferase